MVLHFGGNSQALSVFAPYTCPSCGSESAEKVDVCVERANLAKGGVPELECAKCGGKLEFDETPESYFGFVKKYAATQIRPEVAAALNQLGLYSAQDTETERPPRIIKLVHNSVTYFRVIGTIGAMFRSRPFVVGAEGELVIDLAEVDRFDVLGQREWRRLLKTTSAQVPSITLVDVTESFLANAADSITIARNIFVASVLVPYGCIDCGKVSPRSVSLDGAEWPLQFPNHVCSTCGGTTRSEINSSSLGPLQKASTSIPEASLKVITRRVEILSRAMTDASVAQAGEGASQPVADDAILGKYRIVRRLSAGGMAEVFLANQIGIGGFEKPVALKRIQHKLLESRHLAIDMFLNEAKIAGRLTHPNIVQVLDVGEVNGALYLAMEYVRGKDLRDIMKKLKGFSQNVPIGIACYVVREVAQALHHAYWSTDLNGSQLSVVHRDVSPHNVIIGYDGSVKLLDFGVAMSAVTEHAQAVVVGKWMYMSPEHSGTSPLDHRSDLFSLGICLYLLVTGALPFQANDPKQVIAKIRAGQYRPPLDVAPDLPPALAQLIEAMLAPNPEERPQSGHQVAATLTEIARSYGIESSATQISDFIADVFADEINVVDTGRMALATGSGSEANESHMTPSERYPRQNRTSLSPFPVASDPRRSANTAAMADPRRTTCNISIPVRTTGNISVPGVDRRPSGNIPIPGVERRSVNVAAPVAVQPNVDGDSMNPETRVSAPRVAMIPPVEMAPTHRPQMPEMQTFGRPTAPPPARSTFKMKYLLVGLLLLGLIIAAYFIVNPA
ncbi:hypothetical protein BH11MYX2_BH11MYX2_03070 [soil metagenome]